MITPPLDMDADRFCLWIREQVSQKGAAHFFGSNGYLVLYSGPLQEFRTEIEKILGRSVRDNKDRGREQAAQYGIKVLDDMPIGIWLDDLNLKNYFNNIFGNEGDLVKAAVTKVWATVSEELVKGAYGKAVTAICGADQKRVFTKYELPQLVKETKLETVNSLPVQLVKEFSGLGIAEAFRLIAKFEILAWHVKAKQAATPKETAKARQEWQERFGLHRRYLADVRKNAPATTPDEQAKLKARKRAIRARYDFKAIKAEIIKDNQPTRALLLKPAPAPAVAI